MSYDSRDIRLGKSKISLKVLNELIEFRTSSGIITSAAAGAIYSYYINMSFNIPLFLAVLASSILLDGAATVFNHYYDYKKARYKEGYLYSIHNPINAYNLAPFMAFFTGIILVGIAGLLGIYIMLSVNWILLPVGCLSVIIMYFYSAGKNPISYGPFSEIVSGLFEGCLVFVISYYVQCMGFSCTVLLVSLPIAIGISNIMLANNTSDVQEDKKNGRKTLSIMIGQENAIKLLYASHCVMYLLNTAYFITGKLPVTIFFLYLLVPLFIIDLSIFRKDRSKAKGFKYVLRNTILFNSTEIVSLLAAALWLR